MKKRYIYRLTEEDLWELLSLEGIPLEIIERRGNEVVFATYEPVNDLEPIEVEEVGEDWKDWRKGFGPVEVGDFVIMPPWKKPVFINPGMSFGTGLHPTTRLCIKLLKEVVRKGDSLLDVGTGSGILAIVSKLFGAERVLGIDVSEEAIRECGKNAKLNGVRVECKLGRPSDVDEVFDVLVANLELPIFREELRNLKRLFKREAVLSGIFGEEEMEEFKRMLSGENMKIVKILEEENWFGVRVSHARN